MHHGIDPFEPWRGDAASFGMPEDFCLAWPWGAAHQACDLMPTRGEKYYQS
jgi:hypothetical protein